jgi:hypothetical protein
MLIPVYDNRTIVAYARSAKHAQTILRGMLQHIPKGWKITVRERDTSIIDLPAGLVYSVHP